MTASSMLDLDFKRRCREQTESVRLSKHSRSTCCSVLISCGPGNAIPLSSYLWNVKLRAAGLKGEALGRAGREQPGSLVRRLHAMLVPPGCDAESPGGDGRVIG